LNCEGLTRSAWLRALAVVGLSNGLFIVLTVSTAALPRETLRERVRAAFRAGDLTQEDYLQFDSRRGVHHYDDCLILQMITDREATLLGRAFSPVVRFKEEGATGVCAMLRELTLADEGQVANAAGTLRYSRYWHGYNPVAATLLTFFDLATVRWLLKGGAYAALAALVLAAGVTHRGLLGVTVAISVMAALFWGLPYFGPSLSHAPGDTFVILSLAWLLVARERMSRLQALLPFCAAYGAVMIYLEFLTGLLPTAAGFLVPIVYLFATLAADRAQRPSMGWRLAAAGLIAFALSAAVTVAAKQALALELTDPQALSAFSNQLKTYTAPAASEPRLPGMLKPFMALLRESPHLTHGSRRGAAVMYGAAGFAWLAAALLALRRPRSLPFGDFLVFGAGVGVVVGWVLVFPNHTFIHAGFMVRIMIVPISLGWAALAWQLTARLKGREGSSLASRAGGV
jgi:hypothetical protein